jgi:hypothetical protein
LALTGQDQEGGLRAGKFQSQFYEVAVIVTQTGEGAARVAQSIVAKFSLYPAKAILPPHGAASVFDGHAGAVLGIPQNGAKPVAQITGQSAVIGGSLRVYIYFPFVAATVRTGCGNAGKILIIFRIINVHKLP